MSVDESVNGFHVNAVLSQFHRWYLYYEEPAYGIDNQLDILWLAGPGSSVTASTHKVGDFAHERVADNEYQLTMNFDWNGILPDGTELAAQTRHSWIVVDDPTERFARIKTIDVEILEPFAPKSL